MTWDWLEESIENVDAGRPIKAPACELLEKIDRFSGTSDQRMRHADET
jgi:hypothetical protein